VSRPLVLVAHGSRDPAAGACVSQLASVVRKRLPETDVRIGFVDVRRPSVADALHGVAEAVVVPAFLAVGFHVRADLPAQLAHAGAPDCCVTPTLGPDPELVRAAAARLTQAGWRPGDAVVLAAAGSSDQRAVADVRTAARLLRVHVGRPVRVGFVATGAPRVDALVAGLRTAGERRVAVASWLLAPGVFQRRVDGCGADMVAEPLGVHPAVVDAVVARYAAAVAAAEVAA